MVEILGGTMTTDPYVPDTGAGVVGAKMALIFKPHVARCKAIDPNGTEWHFHLVQVVRDTVVGPGLGAQGNVGFRDRSVANGPSAGWGLDMEWQAQGDASYRTIVEARAGALRNRIAALPALIQAGDPSGALAAELADCQAQQALDTLKATPAGRAKAAAVTSLDPRYAQQRISELIPLFTTKVENTGGNALILPAPYTVGINARATLRDNPSSPVAANVLGMDFETAVLFEYGQPGARHSRYVGSVRWGWSRTAGKSDVQLVPLAEVSNAGVSADFTAAVTLWNGLTVPDPRNAPAQLPVMVIPTQ
ncbi:hypothetical protein Lfu02_78810 [Longispora fulva]|uniref:Uncharacterized protein n=1 Tax=Longispora fulva TaxID=619741 RepID=A0A8J7GLY6_9ACTN|nr:hypothetical protein [Longispora fulva]MBG6134008.1 hypothetical protein [Longispora fulva]GIG63509.1 hypothetical protein Lfu02_78810 [Longispora fulva]